MLLFPFCIINLYQNQNLLNHSDFSDLISTDSQQIKHIIICKTNSLILFFILFQIQVNSIQLSGSSVSSVEREDRLELQEHACSANGPRINTKGKRLLPSISMTSEKSLLRAHTWGQEWYHQAKTFSFFFFSKHFQINLQLKNIFSLQWNYRQALRKKHTSHK